MGKTYYAGVPGMHEQFGPTVSGIVKRGLPSSRKHRQTPSPGSAFLTVLFSLPVLPIAGALMMVGESFKLLSTPRFTPEWKQTVFNVKWGFGMFVFGCLAYSAIFS